MSRENIRMETAKARFRGAERGLLEGISPPRAMAVVRSGDGRESNIKIRGVQMTERKRLEKAVVII